MRLGSGEPRLEVVLFGGRVVLPTVTAGTGARQLGAAGLMVPWIRALENERTSAPDTMRSCSSLSVFCVQQSAMKNVDVTKNHDVCATVFTAGDWKGSPSAMASA